MIKCKLFFICTLISVTGQPSTAIGQSNFPSPSNNSHACKEAREELEFVSSIRTLSRDEKRMRMNAAIAQVNAECGTQTPLMQEPDKVIINRGDGEGRSQ